MIEEKELEQYRDKKIKITFKGGVEVVCVCDGWSRAADNEDGEGATLNIRTDMNEVNFGYEVFLNEIEKIEMAKGPKNEGLTTIDVKYPDDEI